MKRFLHFQTGPLREQAPGDGGGGGGGGAPPAFDPAAFQASLMSEVQKTVTNAMKAWKPPAAAQPAATAAEPAATAAAADPNARPRDPAMAALERQNRELQARFAALETESQATRKQADEKERQAAISTALGAYTFASDDARGDAERAFRDEVKRGDDGELYGGDMVPLKDYVKTRMATKTHLLAPRAVDSAGARPSAGMFNGAPVQVEQISPSMDPKARAAAWDAVRAAMGIK
jgi:hypothetical protein